MSAIDTPVTLNAGEPAAAAPASSVWLTRFDAAVVWLGERMNPILVKECRQALKSKQFTVTFALLLLCGWGWSILGVAWIGPDIFYSFSGPEMFYGYYLVLALPLIVVVPFGAFRSLASEVEDRTYELLSITTLRPRQIVGGKLGSAIVQMIVYFSAISPCLGFTYMLRGLDVITIGVILFYTFLGSLALSMIALLIATITSERHWQVVLSVALVLGLAFVFFMACGLAMEGLQWLTMTPDFWVINAGVVAAVMSYVVLFYLAAASQLTFITDNRSTPLRVVMVIQQVLFAGWIAWLCKELSLQNVGDIHWSHLAYMIAVGIHWFAMGSLMIGESPQLSSRVKRNLPHSFLGRIFLTWFNPGPGTGYMFTLVNLVGAMLMVLTGELVWSSLFSAGAGGGGGWLDTSQILFFGVLGICYIAIYLGVGRLIMMLLGRYVQVTLPLALLLEILMLLAGCGVPLVIYWMSDLRLSGYSLLHISNPLFSLFHIVEKNQALGSEAPTLLMILAPLALLVIVLNLPSILAEVRNVRIARPKRVQEEDAQIEAQLHPVQHKPTSPWD